MLFRTVFGINKSRLDLKFINFRLIKNIFKASSQISVSTVIVFACSFLKNKIFAIYLGVAGIGIVSQLTSFINLLNFVVPLGIPNGLSKYVAEKDLYQSNELKVLFNNSLNLVIAPTIIAAIFIFFFANWISVQLFSSEDFTLYVKIIAILMPFVIFNSLFEGFFRSLDRINLYVKLNIFANIFGIFVIVLGTILFGLLGGLVGILSINIVYVFLSIYFVIKLDIFSFKSFNLKIEKEFLVKLIKVSFVFLVSGGLFQLTLLIIRKTIISDFGIYYNGIYQSTIAVSLNYFGFIFLSLSTYSVPIISKLFSKDDINNELNLNIRYINLLIVPLVAIAFISRYLIIAVLYSDKFFEAQNLYLYQFLGDYFKALSWAIGLWLVPKMKLKYFLIIELCLNINLILIFHILLFFMPGMLECASIAYLLTYIIHFILNYSVTKRSLGFKFTNLNIKQLLLSLLIILPLMIISFFYVNLGYYLFIPVIAVWGYFSVTKDEISKVKLILLRKSSGT